MQFTEPATNSDGNDVRTVCIPPVIKSNTQGAIKPGPGPPLHILAAISCPIDRILPSATLKMPQQGSKPLSSSPMKYCSLTSSKAPKKKRFLLIFAFHVYII